MIVKLLNNQKKAITHLQTKKVGALFKAPGTGKTRTAVELINQTDVDLVLWFAPYRSVNPKEKSSGIKKEVAKWTNTDNYHFYGIESIGMSDRIYLELLALIKDKRVFVVCDESLLIKNNEAKRTQRLIEISQQCEYKLILNGTPFSKNLLDLYPQMFFLSPKILNMPFTQFYNTFCCVKKIYKKGKLINEFVTGYENVDYLYHLIKPFIYEAELVLDIDVQHIEMRYTPCLVEYKEIKEYFLENIEEYDNNIFLMMVQKMQQSYSDDQTKLPLIDEIIKKHGIENIAFYYKFIRTKDFLKKNYPNANIFSLQSESMSLNLQDKLNVTVEVDKTWDYKNVDQYLKRVFRTGQKRNVYHYYLIANCGLDTLIKTNNNNKKTALRYFKNISRDEKIQQIKERL